MCLALFSVLSADMSMLRFSVPQVPFPGRFVERVAAGLQHAAALVGPVGRHTRPEVRRPRGPVQDEGSHAICLSTTEPCQISLHHA